MEEQEETAYHTPNGIIKKLDTFKGKKALIGDYFAPSYYNTKMVLDSLGFEMTIVKTYYDVIEKINHKVMLAQHKLNNIPMVEI